MNLADRGAIVGILGFVITIPMAPLLAYFLRRARLFAVSSWTAPIAIAVLTSWILQIIFRTAIELPLNMEKAKARGDLMYDGVGGNVAVLMAGWLEPLILCFALVGLTHLLSRKNRNEN